MRIRIHRVVLLAVLLAAGGCASGGTQTASPSGGTSTVAVPFETFVRGLDSARYADYAHRAGASVRDAQAFEEMRRYLLDRYRDARVAASLSAGGAVFDCVRAADPTAPPPGPADSTAPPPGPAGCPAGTIPLRRTTLDELVRFPTLQGFLAKDPGGGGLPPVPPPS